MKTEKFYKIDSKDLKNIYLKRTAKNWKNPLTLTLIMTLSSKKKYAGPKPRRNQLARITQWMKNLRPKSPTLIPGLVNRCGNLPTIVKNIRTNSVRYPAAPTSTHMRRN